jgi:amino acid transporter
MDGPDQVGSPPASARGGGPYHPRTESATSRGGRLGLRDSTAMAIGGMIGGGIFSVLGVTIALAGHLAFVSFLLGAVLAALTARALARLASRSGRSGGPFTYLRDEGHPAAAAWVAWLLAAGYVFALSVYAFTFGHYLANVIGAGELVARLGSIASLAVFLGLNLRGVSASALVEDVVVAAKLAVLLVVSLYGISQFQAGRLSPPANEGQTGLLLGAAVIFVAYEGFELLPYDYGDMRDAGVTLPRAMYLAVAIVMGVYVLVTLGSQMLVSDHTILTQKEVAFAIVGKKAFGQAGLWAATLAALLSTSSAINATLFSTARLLRDVSLSGELPARIGREQHGLPVGALLWISVLGAAFAMLPGVTEIVSFGSLTFLVVFALINHQHAVYTATSTPDRALAWLGTLGCTAASIILLYYLARHDRAGLALIGVTGTVLVAARVAFTRTRRTAVPSA